MRKTVLYVIDDLGRGGAETLLVGILPSLQQFYDIILVTLSDHCEFSEEELTVKYRYTLGFKGKASFLTSVFRLKKIIRKHRPDLAHSHLVNSSIVLRLALREGIPVFCSIHSQLSKNVYEGSWIYRNLERRLFNKEHIVVAVTQEVLDDYQCSIGTPLRGVVLHNYIGDEFFQTKALVKVENNRPLKFVAVGNIKKVKNYEYLVRVFALLKNYPVSLDIFGKGDEKYEQALREAAIQAGANICFQGQARNVHQLLPGYDCYILSSLHEGFGIAAVEAMAIGLPVLLSDLPVLREVTENNALFFDLKDTGTLATIIKKMHAGEIDTAALTVNGIRVARKYSKTKYVERLVSIYDNFVFNQS